MWLHDRVGSSRTRLRTYGGFSMMVKSGGFGERQKFLFPGDNTATLTQANDVWYHIVWTAGTKVPKRRRRLAEWTLYL